MADIVLGIATSHTPLLSLQPEPWLTYAEGDFRNPELLAYVPVYRTPAATGGGWAFARWQ